MSCTFLKKIDAEIYYCPFPLCKKFNKCLKEINKKEVQEIPEIFQEVKHTEKYLHILYKTEKKVLEQFLKEHTPLYGVARYMQIPISETKLMLKNEGWKWKKNYDENNYYKGEK